MLIFVPLAPAGLAAWVGDGRRDVAGFAATVAFLDAFGLDRDDDEDADLTLLEIAGVAGLLTHGVRLVAVCSAVGTPAEPVHLGAVTAARVPWSDVSSLFTDDVEGAARAASAREGLSGAGLAAAWDAAAITALVGDVDLLWHHSSEWDRLTH